MILLRFLGVKKMQQNNQIKFKVMLWKELQASINAMSDEDLNKEVFVWGDDISLSHVTLEESPEDMLFNGDYDDYCVPRSDAGQEMIDDPHTRLACVGGLKYLLIEEGVK